MIKILIIRFSSIGDIVLTSPVIRCIREQVPGAQIHYLTKKQFVPLLKENPHIEKLHYINKGVMDVIPDLRGEQFDFIIDLHRNFRSNLVKHRLKKPAATFSKLNARKWLLVNFKINRMPDLHLVDRYFHAVKPLNVSNDNRGLEYYIPEEDNIGKDDIPEQYRNGFVAFAIGGKHNTKCLPAEKILSLCKKISKPVILLGGDEDAATARMVKDNAGDHVFNACGLYNINQSASLVRMADKVITHDTGLMHIAAAFGKEIISVWGSTVPQFGMYPYAPQHPGRVNIIQVEGLKCRPCSKIGFEKCPKKHFNCMELINEEDILEIVNREPN